MKKAPAAADPSHDRRPSRASLGLAFACLVCALVYAAGLHGGFLFDDYHDIVPNAVLQSIGSTDSHWLQLALSSNSGPLRRPLSMLSFGLNVYAFGMNPFFFKLVNLAIHLANGALIYAIGCRIASRLIPKGDQASVLHVQFLTLIAAGLWLLHPLNISSVLYIVQRMNQLSTLFALAGLLCYVDGRIRLLRGEAVLTPTLVALCLFGLLATFSKENGALTFAYALVIEAVCFRFDAPRVIQRRILKGFFLASVALPLGLFAAYLLMHPDWPAHAYSNRSFTLTQRLLSETRILFHYLLWIFVPDPSWMGMFHDDIAPSKDWLQPISTVFACLLLAALAIASWALRKTVPGFAFALAWFLVGHSMESTFLPLELIFEHRNYLPMAGLLLGTVCTLVPILSQRISLRAIHWGAAVLLLAFATLTATRAASWGNPLTLALDDARHHPDSSRTQYEAGREIVIAGATRGERAKADQEAAAYFQRAAELDQTELAGSINLMLIEAGNGPVQPAAIADLADRLSRATSYVQINPFLDMLSAANRGNLSLTRQDFSKLVDAALTNPRLPPSTRAMILNNFGEYCFNVAHDGQTAIELTTAAAATEPKNPYFQINLAKIALAMGRKDIAQKHLDAAKELNRVGIYNQEILTLQRQTMQ